MKNLILASVFLFTAQAYAVPNLSCVGAINGDRIEFRAHPQYSAIEKISSQGSSIYEATVYPTDSIEYHKADGAFGSYVHHIAISNKAVLGTKRWVADEYYTYDGLSTINIFENLGCVLQ